MLMLCPHLSPASQPVLAAVKLFSCRRANQLYLPLSGAKTQIRRGERRTARSVLLAVSVACRYCSAGDKRGIGTEMSAGLSWRRRTVLAPPVNPTRRAFYRYLTRRNKLNFFFSTVKPFLVSINTTGSVLKGPDCVTGLWGDCTCAHLIMLESVNICVSWQGQIWWVVTTKLL